MRVRALLLTLGALLLAPAAPAHAAVYTVTGTADPGTCDGFSCTGLQAALNAAKTSKGADEVDLKKATYVASKGLTMSDAEGVTVVGVGAQDTVLKGNTGVRTLGNSGTGTLQHLKVTGGSLTNTDGGGISNSGTLTLDHVEVSGNSAENGGGIASTGTLTILDSLIDGNTAAGDGGGLFLTGVADGSATKLTMRDSTVAFNTGQIRSGAGGIDMRGNPANTATLQRVTVADNTGGNPDLGAGGILVAGDGEVLAASATIVAGNKNVTGAPSNCIGAPRDDGANVESGTDCAFRSGKQNANPGFPTGLMSDGGETDVLPIPSTSPAVDLGPACSGVTDQRDLARPQGKTCDAGAYEYDQPPDTAITGGPGGLVNTTNATFTFTSTDPGSTFRCTLDNGTPATCPATQTYNGLAQGSHTLSVQAVDPAQHADATPATAAWTVDSVPPNTTFTSTPPTRVNGAISFSFSASEAGSTFQCRLDTPAGAGGYAACTSPRAYSGLVAGNYRFHVVATDAAQNTDPTEATWDFQVDLTPPDTTLTPIADPTNDKTPAFTFGSTESGSTFECKVDSAAFAACTSPFTTGGLSDGSHTFQVRAKDAAGNTDGTPAAQTFVVDTVAPDTTLTPIATPTNDATPTFAFGATEAGSTFQCRLDAAAFAACTPPRTTATLADGSHTFQVRATDAAGNTDGTPAAQTFTINTSAPTVTFSSGPSGPIANASPTFAFAASAPATFQCRFDADPFAGCAPPFTPAAALAEGAHTLEVQARDAAGNVGSALRTFVVDLTPPATPTVDSGPSGVTSDASPSFTFAPSDGGATIECSLSGPGQAGAFAPCSSPAGFSGLAPGQYTFTVRAADAAGNTTTSSRSFTVAAPQQATPTPSPTPSPPPTPVANQTVVVQPAGGTVLVRLKGSKTFVPLDATQGIPLGSEVDTRHGKVELSAVPKAGGKVETALFYGGLFIVTQSGGITQLALSEGLAACPRGHAASAAAKQKPKTRNLWGDGHGSFRTKGRYSAATVRGTKWNVQDACAGTLTRVSRGVVAVNDLVKHKTKVLRAGQRYLAQPKRR